MQLVCPPLFFNKKGEELDPIQWVKCLGYNFQGQHKSDLLQLVAGEQDAIVC